MANPKFRFDNVQAGVLHVLSSNDDALLLLDESGMHITNRISNGKTYGIGESTVTDHLTFCRSSVRPLDTLRNEFEVVDGTGTKHIVGRGKYRLTPNGEFTVLA